MIAAMSATSCSDDDNEKVVMPDPDPTTLGWVKQTTEFGTLPEYISVYKSPSELEGMKAISVEGPVGASHHLPGIQSTSEKTKGNEPGLVRSTVPHLVHAKL